MNPLLGTGVRRNLYLFFELFHSTLILFTKTEHVHRTDRYADSAADAGAVDVINRFLLESKPHHIDPHLAVSRTFVASNTFVIGGLNLPTPSLVKIFDSRCMSLAKGHQ